MNIYIILTLLAVSLLVGLVAGYFLRWIVSLGKRGSIELKLKQMMLEAQDDAKRITNEAEKKAEAIVAEARTDSKEKEALIQKTEERLAKREEFLDNRQVDLDKEENELKAQEEALETKTEELQKLETDRKAELERISQLSADDAKTELLKTLEREADEDLTVRIQKLENDQKERLERKAQEILTTSVQRLANNVSMDLLSTNVAIPSDEIKGKIIGKEGRNIKAFERALGVELIIDDTPGAITISSFDPIRRQIARVALENLILDGRVQPARIEEEAQKAKEEINKIIQKKGEEAVYETGVFNLDSRVVMILGRLYFRTSYGQNVLQHSVEMAHLAGMMAEELGADVAIAKAGALLHDIGKAIDHEVSGTHVEIGRRILHKFGVDERVVKAMEAHHDEYPYETLESHIVQAADAISGARPGARRDTVENYIKRLEELEGVANHFDGVDKAYAIQAGREIRVFVTPDEVNDVEARKLARNIALEIEKELTYPGEIKVTLIRESRCIEYAR